MDGKYYFDHSKIQEFLYQEISSELKKEYHAILANHLEEINKDRLEAITNDLAYHYYRAGDKKKGIQYLLRAGKDAWDKLAIFEAIRYYNQALEMMENRKNWEIEKTRILENLGSINALMNDPDMANKYFEKGIASTSDEKVKNRMRKKIRRTNTVEKDGVKREYFVYGEGKKTIFFIGYVNAATFFPQVSFFSQGCKVITMDTLGIWEKERFPGKFTIDLYTDDLKVIIDDLQEKEIFPVGVGMGGAIAINYVAKYPGKIAKLALSGTNPKPSVAFMDDARKKRFEAFWEKAFLLPSLGLKKFYEILFPGPENERLREWNLDIVAMYPPELVLMHWKIFCETDISTLLGKIKIPTLIVQGEKDPLPMAAVKYLNDKISESQFVVIKNTVYVAIFEPDKYNKILKEFMNTGKVDYD